MVEEKSMNKGADNLGPAGKDGEDKKSTIKNIVIVSLVIALVVVGSLLYIKNKEAKERAAYNAKLDKYIDLVESQQEEVAYLTEQIEDIKDDDSYKPSQAGEGKNGFSAGSEDSYRQSVEKFMQEDKTQERIDKIKETGDQAKQLYDDLLESSKDFAEEHKLLEKTEKARQELSDLADKAQSSEFFDRSAEAIRTQARRLKGLAGGLKDSLFTRNTID